MPAYSSLEYKHYLLEKYSKSDSYSTARQNSKFTIHHLNVLIKLIFLIKRKIHNIAQNLLPSLKLIHAEKLNLVQNRRSHYVYLRSTDVNTMLWNRKICYFIALIIAWKVSVIGAFLVRNFPHSDHKNSEYGHFTQWIPLKIKLLSTGNIFVHTYINVF